MICCALFNGSPALRSYSTGLNHCPVSASIGFKHTWQYQLTLIYPQLYQPDVLLVETNLYFLTFEAIAFRSYIILPPLIVISHSSF